MTATAMPIPTPLLHIPPHVYALHMFNERIHLLVSKEQRLLLEREAKRRGASVASVIREAVDERYGGIGREERMAAVESIAAIRGIPAPSPEELSRMLAEAYDAETRFPPEGAPE